MLNSDDTYGFKGVTIDRAEVREQDGSQELRLYLRGDDGNVLAVVPDRGGGLTVSDVTSMP